MSVPKTVYVVVIVGVAVNEAVVLPVGVQVKVDNVPPVAAIASCVLPPEQTETGVADAVMEVGDNSWFTITDLVEVQLLASVMVAI